MTPEIVQQYNQATNLLNRAKYEKAIPIYRKLLTKSSFKEAWINLGNCYRFLDQDARALECYHRADDANIPYLNGTMEPHYNLALNNLGLLEFCYGRDDAAIKYYDLAISRDPNFADAQWNRSTALLRKACSGYPELFKSAWQAYNWRFKKTPPVQLKNNVAGLLQWDGSRVKSLVVLAEQGLGDNIQWSRYIPLLEAMVDKLWIQCDPSIAVLFDGYNTCFHVSESDATHGVPICSLSQFFDQIPDATWRTFNEKHNFESGFNIGIVHSGSPTHANDRNRSTNINRFHRFAKYGNLYSLQPGFKTTKYVRGLEIKGWADTIAYINGLDLVICVDTSVAHMAGLLGKECWLLQPLKETDFRWGSHQSESNVWYSSIRVIRNPGSWDHVFDTVETMLKDRFYV